MNKCVPMMAWPIKQELQLREREILARVPRFSSTDFFPNIGRKYVGET